MLDKKAILELNDIRIEKVHVPEWKGDIYIKEMTGNERDSFALAHRVMDKTKSSIGALYAVFTVVDKDGNLLFSEADISSLSKKSGKALDRIFDKAEELNRVFSDIEDDAKKS